MELMLVVWVVSFLSELRSLADFVVWPVVIVAFVLFCLSKVQLDAVFKRAALRLHDGLRVTVTEPLVATRSTVPAGVYRLSTYSTYSYLCSDDKRYEINNDLLIEYLQTQVSNEAVLPAKPLCSGVGSLYAAAIALLTLTLTVPSDTTIKYMAGAYLIQSVYESTEAREIGAASKKAVMSQLEVWSKGNEQLLTLIEQIKPAVQEKVHDYSTIGAQQ